MRGGRWVLLFVGAGLLALVGQQIHRAWSRSSESSLPAMGTSRGTDGSNATRAQSADGSYQSVPLYDSSLAGTVVDGALVVDENGVFVPTPDAIDFFQYYFSLLGEVPETDIIAKIEREIRARVRPPDEALAFFRRYLGYRDRVRDLDEARGGAGLSLGGRLEALQAIRRDVFGEEVSEVLFGEQEARVRDAIAWREVASDPDLSEEERAARLEALESALPEHVRDRRARATVAIRSQQHESELRAAGAGPEEIQAWREREFGAEAAARLAELDQKRAEWDARLQRYHEEKARVEASHADETQAAAAVEALRAEHFDGPELLRVRAIDEVQAGSGR